MSLINQMLRDLDARRSPASHMEVAALEGMGLTTPHHVQLNTVLFRSAVAASLILAGILLQLGYQSWSEKTHPAHEPRREVTKPATRLQQTDSIAIVPATAHKEKPVPTSLQPAHSKTEFITTPPITGPNVIPAPVSQDNTTKPIDIPVKEIAVVQVRKPLTPAQQSQRKFARAQKLLARGELRAAMEVLRAALERDAGHTQARLQLATLYYRKNRITEARQLLGEGHLLDPADAGITMAYARLLADAGDYQLAIDVLDDYRVQESAGPETFALAASLHYQLKQFDLAASRYRTALARQPGQGIWWMGLGVTLEHNQQPGQALAAYRRAAPLLQDDALQTFVKGRVTTLSETKE